MLNIKKIALIVTLSAFSCSGWALEALDDANLAQAVGQSGVTVELGTVANAGVIGFDRVSLQDGNGFVGNTGPASIGYFTATTGTGIGFYSGATGTTAIAKPIKIVLDADGNGTGNALFNANIGFASGLTRINLSPFTIRLTADTANHATNPNDHGIVSQRDILKVGGSGIDVLLNAGSDLGVNLQLGSQPQGRMMVFSGGQIKQIKNVGAPVELVSSNGAATSSLKFNFDLSANAASTNGIQLAGMYIDLNNTSLLLGKDGALDKFNLTISDLVAGTAGQSDVNAFNGLKNGSMGNIGVIGAKVTNLRVNVKGM